jgi:STE24 endopeptidase
LAHEIGHYKKKHIIQGMVISIVHLGVLFLLISLFLNSPGLYHAFYLKQPSIYAGLLFFALLYTPIEFTLSIVMQAVSRNHEYAADRFAAETIKNPDDLITGLKKLHTNNLSNLTPHPLYVFLNYSHPPLLQRIQAIRNAKHPDRV